MNDSESGSDLTPTYTSPLNSQYGVYV